MRSLQPSLGPSNRPRRPQPFRLLPPTPVPRSLSAQPSHPAHPRGSGSPAARGVPGGRRRPRAGSAGGSGPGLPASGRACQCRPLPRGSPAISARRFEIGESSVQSGPAQCQFRACGSGLPLQPPSLGPWQPCPVPGLLASPPAPPRRVAARLHRLPRSQASLRPALSVTEFLFRLHHRTPGAPGWASPRASRPRPPRPPGRRAAPARCRRSPLTRRLTPHPALQNPHMGAHCPPAQLEQGGGSAGARGRALRWRRLPGRGLHGRCCRYLTEPATPGAPGLGRRHLGEVREPENDTRWPPS